VGRLEGKVAFLTGAGAGIAKATAMAYVREGARVAIVEINPAAGQAAEREIRGAGGDAFFIETDIAFTRTLAAQYVQHGIRANAIAPGSIRTERQIKRYENKDSMLAEKTAAAARERAATQKLYPFSVGEPGDVAAIAVFLASDESRMLTGTTIAADGGRSSYLKVNVAED
jgi:NAD(P)-dependent dehydrogenase (short-subunit alcohol dehydrogenase family)